MSYRKITVDNKTYQYVIGKSHVKIVGIGAFLKTEIGSEKEFDTMCHCCGQWMTNSMSRYTDGLPTRFSVTPKEVAAFIQKQQIISPVSSVGRAVTSKLSGRRFESDTGDQIFNNPKRKTK